jgi:hypothetical protein
MSWNARPRWPGYPNWVRGRETRKTSPSSIGPAATLVVGRFADGVGTFYSYETFDYSYETFDGNEITVRSIWSDIIPRLGPMGTSVLRRRGKTWETNWIMEFTSRRQL